MSSFKPTFWPLGLALFLGLAAWLVLTGRFNQVPQVPVPLGGETDPNAEHINAFILALGYGVTLIGAVLGAIFRELQAVRQSGATTIIPGEFFRNVFLSTDLWLSIVASPIAYALIWRTLDADNIPGLVTVALQNGLFCTVVASSFLAHPPTTPNEKANQGAG